MRMKRIRDRPMEHPLQSYRVRVLERMITDQMADQIGLTVSRRRLADDVRRLHRLTGRMAAERLRLQATHSRLRFVRREIQPAGNDR